MICHMSIHMTFVRLNYELIYVTLYIFKNNFNLCNKLSCRKMMRAKNLKRHLSSGLGFGFRDEIFQKGNHLFFLLRLELFINPFCLLCPCLCLHTFHIFSYPNKCMPPLPSLLKA